jgi:hypothetical protein
MGKKIAGAAKRFAIPLYLAFVGVVTWIFLWTTAMTVGPFGKLSYPDTIARIVTASLIASLIPAIIMLVLKRKARYNYMLIRVVAMIVSVLFCILFLAGVIRWAGRMGVGNTTFAESLMGLAGIPGVAAIILLGAFAYYLARYKEDDGVLDEQRDELAGVERELANARARAHVANKQYARHRTAHENHETRRFELEETSKRVGQEWTDANEKYNESEPVKAIKTKKEKIATNDTRIDDLDKSVTKLQVEIDKRKDPRDKAVKQGEQDRARDERDNLIAENDKLRKEIATLQQEADDSDEKRQLDAATVRQERDTETVREYNEESARLKKRVTDASEEMSKAGGDVKAHEAHEAELNETLNSADKADRSVWRDLVFPLATTFILAVLFFPTWQGYVMTALL